MDIYDTMQDLTHNSHPISIPNSSNNIHSQRRHSISFFEKKKKNISKQFQNNWAGHYFQVISHFKWVRY